MKLRTIVLVLALLAFVSTSTCGYIYYSSARESLFEAVQLQVASEALTIRHRVSSSLTEHLDAVKVLAGIDEIKRALAGPSPVSLERANRILDLFQGSLNAGVCYLMDKKGNTIAASNRYEPGSFVGKNYAFRPYFQKAIKGIPWSYMALGITSGKRGLYYSHPVYLVGQGQPIGCVVIKASVEALELKIDLPSDGAWMLVAPEGVVFATNRRSWLFHSIHPLTLEQIDELEKKRQLGHGPWTWAGLTFHDDGNVSDRHGNRYLQETIELDLFPGWKLIYLLNHRAVSSILSNPLMKNTGLIVLLLLIFIGLSVFFLYNEAISDILQRKKLARTLRSQNDYLASLHDISLSVISRLEVAEVVETILERAGALIGTPHGFIFIYRPELRELEMAYAKGEFEDKIGYRTIPEQGFVGRVWGTGQPLKINNYAKWTGRLNDPRLDKVHSIIGIPLKSESQASGVLGLAHFDPSRTFRHSDMDILNRFSALASIALDNARLHEELRNELKERKYAELALQDANEELQRLVFIDGLTQVANRRLFDQHLAREWNRLLVEQKPLSLIMCDIDFFKFFNDTYGHLSGDDCLCAVARAICVQAQTHDLVARYGGEEFAVVLPELDFGEAEKAAEKIRNSVIRLKTAHSHSPIHNYVTVSLGVSSVIPFPGGSPDILVATADQALYRAKAGGRNCVVSLGVRTG